MEIKNKIASKFHFFFCRLINCVCYSVIMDQEEKMTWNNKIKLKITSFSTEKNDLTKSLFTENARILSKL